MFTGLVESVGSISSLEKKSDGSSQSIELTITNFNFKSQLGDSVALNGCCLTVSETSCPKSLKFFVSSETLARTNLGLLHKNSVINLERAMIMSQRLDGHLVSGHIDSIAEVLNILKSKTSWELILRLPHEHRKLIVYKGSICINGVSLTINTIKDHHDSVEISICLIPTTLDKTNLAHLTSGSIVNVEYDMVGKYIRRHLELSNQAN